MLDFLNPIHFLGGLKTLKKPVILYIITVFVVVVDKVISILVIRQVRFNMSKQKSKVVENDKAQI